MITTFQLLATTLVALVFPSVRTSAPVSTSVSTPSPALSVATARQSAQSMADELLAADRAFSAASATTDLVSGLTAMLSARVMMPLPNGQFAHSAAEVEAALRANADNAKSRAAWTPVRAGVSADGLHGFTFGFMTVHNPDGSTAPGKYMAYWEREPRGWRVIAYKRRRVSAAAVPQTLAAALPERLAARTTDRAVLDAQYRSLIAREQEFSDVANRIGLGLAFQRFGSADAVNMGAPTEPRFVVGAEAIGKVVVGDGALDGPSPVTWNADTAFVASSGDLGITFGIIRPNTPPPAGAASGAAPGSAFFTIWRRASRTAPWLYVAE